MIAETNGRGALAGIAAGPKSVSRARGRAVALVIVGALGAIGGFPGVAQAHGPVAPIASSYLARVSGVPPGLRARVIDGDQRIWLRATATETAVVLDYRGAPYLRFSASGVAVNRNSAMYYVNQTPVEVPPSSLRPSTRPRWSSVSGGHDYSWHDGRLHALATVALTSGAAYVGRWSIPVRVNGRLSAISGGLWHAENPSIVWFWPIVVLLACTLAVRRVRRRELDARVARGLALAALIATASAGVARELHGRPTVSAFQMITFAIIVAFVVWGLRRLLFHRAGPFSYFAIAFVAIYEGGQLIPTLLTGFVLAAEPAFVARATAVVCLGCGGALVLVAFRLADETEPDPLDSGDPNDEYDGEDAGARESYA